MTHKDVALLLPFPFEQKNSSSSSAAATTSPTATSPKSAQKVRKWCNQDVETFEKKARLRKEMKEGLRKRGSISEDDSKDGKDQREIKKRKILTRQQTRYLLDYFKGNPRPNKSQRKEISKFLADIDERAVRVWFQNKRTKLRLTNSRQKLARKLQNGLNNSSEEDDDLSQDEEMMNSDEQPMQSDDEDDDESEVSQATENLSSSYEQQQKSRIQNQFISSSFYSPLRFPDSNVIATLQLLKTGFPFPPSSPTTLNSASSPTSSSPISSSLDEAKNNQEAVSPKKTQLNFLLN